MVSGIIRMPGPYILITCGIGFWTTAHPDIGLSIQNIYSFTGRDFWSGEIWHHFLSSWEAQHWQQWTGQMMRGCTEWLGRTTVLAIKCWHLIKIDLFTFNNLFSINLQIFKFKKKCQTNLIMIIFPKLKTLWQWDRWGKNMEI